MVGRAYSDKDLELAEFENDEDFLEASVYSRFKKEKAEENVR
jgi:hypothetical protein